MADDGRELRQLPQLERGKVRLDHALIIVGGLSRRPSSGLFDDLPLADVLRCDHGGIVIGDGEDEFVAQVEHEDIRVAFVERAVKRRVSLGRENDGRARFAK